MKAKCLGRHTLEIVSVNNTHCKLDTQQYEISLISKSGQKHVIHAYGIPDITGVIPMPNAEVVNKLFPEFESTDFCCGSHNVDILLGNDYYGLHPKKEIAKAGENLSLMQGPLGNCIVGCHPLLSCSVAICNRLQTKIKSFKLYQHPEFSNSNHLCKTCQAKVDSFISGEEMGTEISPKCGNCKCGKCPISGHNYSFVEEQELKIIQDNLTYDPERLCWVTKYPWVMDPSLLPDNFYSALATLRNTERTLQKDSEWAVNYQKQMQDMLDRNVARLLTPEEMANWTGPFFYISHLAVVNPKSKSTPIRIVFNSSQPFKGISLNSTLAKGPDNYLNNLLGILLRWRERPIAIISDIRKMYNSIHIDLVEQHCHRFLWRNLETDKDPNVYVMTRVNMGDKPAGAISTEAVYKTASMFKDKFPDVAELLLKSTYVDDIVDSVETIEDAVNLGINAEWVLSQTGFKLKYWQFTGDSIPRNSAKVKPATSQNETENVAVLGLKWNPLDDCILFLPALNFSEKRKGIHTSPDLSLTDIPRFIPMILTKRQVLEQTMRIYDPLGILSPFTLTAKCYLRETWSLGLSWDKVLPDYLKEKWVCFFNQLVSFIFPGA